MDSRQFERIAACCVLVMELAFLFFPRPLLAMFVKYAKPAPTSGAAQNPILNDRTVMGLRILGVFTIVAALIFIKWFIPLNGHSKYHDY